MASQLLDIYEALAGMTVTAASKTPTVWEGDEAQDSIQSVHLPVRLIVPSGHLGQRGTGDNLRLATQQGSLITVRWGLSDLCLWQMVGQGIGIKGLGTALAAYAAAYMTALAVLELPAKCYPVDANLTSGVFEWPQQSGVWFWGVQIAVYVDELF